MFEYLLAVKKTSIFIIINNMIKCTLDKNYIYKYIYLLIIYFIN